MSTQLLGGAHITAAELELGGDIEGDEDASPESDGKHGWPIAARCAAASRDKRLARASWRSYSAAVSMYSP